MLPSQKRSPAMPRKLRPPSYLEHSSGQARTVIRLPGRKAETRYLGAYGSDESYVEHERIVREWRYAQRDGEPMPRKTPATTLTINELLLRFDEHAKVYYRKSDGTPT